MSVEVLDSSIDAGNEYDDAPGGSSSNLDARRLVEDKIEEMRLMRETQEYDFDV